MADKNTIGSRVTDMFNNSSQVSPETIQAYLETNYRVFADESFTLRIGCTSPQLRSAHARRSVDSSAFLTAWNPFSQSLDAEQNRARQETLKADLVTRDLYFEPGAGEHPSNGWPPEDSVLVYGLSLEEAKLIGRRADQNAIVWAGPDAVPQLILLR